MTREEFGQKLKELRNRSKLTQTEVADFLGLKTNGKGRISDWERGKGQPDADTFLVLCDLYNEAVWSGKSGKSVENNFEK